MIDFPSSPTNGQTIVAGTSTYTYNSVKDTWDLSTTTVVGPTGPAGNFGPTGPAGNFSVAATTAPASPTTGATWFNSDNGNTYIYYDSYWVQIESAGPVGATGPAGAYTTSGTAPGAPTTGQAWLNTEDGRLYIYNGTAWFEPTNNQAGSTGPTGPSGIISVTGPVTNSGTSTAAIIGVDSTVAILTSTQTLTNKTLNSLVLNEAARENLITTGTGFAGYTFNVLDDAVQFITANSTANGTVNIRASATVSLNTWLAVNQSVTIVLAVTNGASAFYPNAWQIDGSAVTPRWSGGTAPSSGNANSIDVYTITIIKTASATYTVLGNQTRFA